MTDNRKIHKYIDLSINSIDNVDTELWHAVSLLTEAAKMCIDKKTYSQSSTGAYIEAMARALDSERSCILKLFEAMKKEMLSYAEEYFPAEEGEE